MGRCAPRGTHWAKRCFVRAKGPRASTCLCHAEMHVAKGYLLLRKCQISPVVHLEPALPSMPHTTSDVQQGSAAPSPPSWCPNKTFCLMQRWTDIRLSSSNLNFSYHETPTWDLDKATAYLASPVTTPLGTWLLLNSQITSKLHAVSLHLMGSAPSPQPSTFFPSPVVF